MAVGSIGAVLEEITPESRRSSSSTDTQSTYASERKKVGISYSLRHSLTFIVVRGGGRGGDLSMSILQDAALDNLQQTITQHSAEEGTEHLAVGYCCSKKL